MRYAQIRKMDISNGEGCGVSIFTQGCPIKCEGCHNASIWNPKEGKEFTTDTLNTVIDLIDKPYISRLSILGGEPLLKENVKSLADLVLIADLMFPNKKIWLWSGYLWEDIYSLAFDVSYSSIGTQQDWNWQDKKNLRNILFSLDVLVDGPFIQEQKDITLKWRGSANQRVIDVQKSLRQNLPILPPPSPILYCD